MFPISVFLMLLLVAPLQAHFRLTHYNGLPLYDLDSKSVEPALDFALNEAGTGYSVIGCSMLNHGYLVIPSEYKGLPVTSIDNYAFYDRLHSYYSYSGGSAEPTLYSVKSIAIPDSVTSIGAHAFHGCSSLTHITIPDSVTSIGAHAFRGCSGLTYITIPDSVTSIGSHAFAYCTSLTSVTIPDSVTSIGASTFDGCSSLLEASISIP